MAWGVEDADRTGTVWAQRKSGVIARTDEKLNVVEISQSGQVLSGKAVGFSFGIEKQGIGHGGGEANPELLSGHAEKGGHSFEKACVFVWERWKDRVTPLAARERDGRIGRHHVDGVPRENGAGS